MSSLRNFAPWIAFGVVSTVADWRFAGAVALVLAVAGAVERHRSGADPDDLANAAVVLFAALTAVGMIDPTSPVHSYIPALSVGAIGIGAAASIIRGRPFTIAFAKRSTSPDAWSHPRFHAANVTISAVWTASFFATAAALAVARVAAPHATGLIIEIQVLGFVVPMRFTALYRRRLRTRFAAAA